MKEYLQKELETFNIFKGLQTLSSFACCFSCYECITMTILNTYQTNNCAYKKLKGYWKILIILTKVRKRGEGQTVFPLECENICLNLSQE